MSDQSSAIGTISGGEVSSVRRSLSASPADREKVASDSASAIEKPSFEAIELAVTEVGRVLQTINPATSLSFRIESDLSRMIVSVREVGSDEIIRQFPPEEFITVAKHIAAQNPDAMDEDYLK